MADFRGPHHLLKVSDASGPSTYCYRLLRPHPPATKIRIVHSICTGPPGRAPLGDGRVSLCGSLVPVVPQCTVTPSILPVAYPAYVRLVDRLLAPWTAEAISISEATREFCVFHAMGFSAIPGRGGDQSDPAAAYTANHRGTLRALRTRYGIAEKERARHRYCIRPLSGEGPPRSLAAFRRILDASPRTASAPSVGDGPERAQSRRAKPVLLHVESRVCFTGFQEVDVAAHLRLLTA
jgi:hypothetical protein